MMKKTLRCRNKDCHMKKTCLRYHLYISDKFRHRTTDTEVPIIKPTKNGCKAYEKIKGII